VSILVLPMYAASVVGWAWGVAFTWATGGFRDRS
jgi:hypothetical protein